MCVTEVAIYWCLEEVNTCCGQPSWSSDWNGHCKQKLYHSVCHCAAKFYDFANFTEETETMCVCVRACVHASFYCQPYLRNQWSNSYHIWLSQSWQCITYLFFFTSSKSFNNMQDYADNTFVCVSEHHKDMLTFISLIASVFVRNLHSVVVSVSPSAQATWVLSRSTPFKKIYNNSHAASATPTSLKMCNINIF